MFDYRQLQFPGFPPGQGGPGFPSYPPGGGQGQGFPGFPPGQGQQGMGQEQMQAPPGPPPSFTPTQATAQTLSTGAQGPSTFAVDPGAIRRCLFRYTYLWLTSGQSFWFYPTFIGRQSISGFRWTGFRWVFYGTDLRRVRSFQCF
ncbi:MAG: transporter [Bacillota bacterium]